MFHVCIIIKSVSRVLYLTVLLRTKYNYSKGSKKKLAHCYLMSIRFTRSNSPQLHELTHFCITPCNYKLIYATLYGRGCFLFLCSNGWFNSPPLSRVGKAVTNCAEIFDAPRVSFRLARRFLDRLARRVLTVLLKSEFWYMPFVTKSFKRGRALSHRGEKQRFDKYSRWIVHVQSRTPQVLRRSSINSP